MKVPYDEGIASHIGPESCVGDREGAGEALTGESAGRVLSRESNFLRGADGVTLRGRQHGSIPPARGMEWPCVVEDPAHAWKRSAREPGDPAFSPGKWPWGRVMNPRGARWR